MGRRVDWAKRRRRDGREFVGAVRAAAAERDARQPQKLSKAEMRAMIDEAMRKREPGKLA